MFDRTSGLRRVVLIVAVLNLLYFFVEFAVARSIGSVSLFADSVDFLEDCSVNILVAVALGWAAKWRARAGMAMAAVILLPAIAFALTAWIKLHEPVAPEATWLSLTGFGALVVNVGCAFMLAGIRNHKGSLTKAAFLSARNEAFANIGIIAAGIVTLYWQTAWPDFIVGISIAVLNIGAAKEVLEAAHGEHDMAS